MDNDSADEIMIFPDVGGWISGPMRDPVQEIRDLEKVHAMWASRYKIEISDGVWRATRIGNSLHTFTADTSQELRAWIYSDYIRWQKEAERHNSVPTENGGMSL